jgi:hypothetical protein
MGRLSGPPVRVPLFASELMYVSSKVAQATCIHYLMHSQRGRAVSSTHPINDPKHWHQRAEEMRPMADGIRDPDAKAASLRIAEEHEVLRRPAEKWAGSR